MEYVIHIKSIKSTNLTDESNSYEKTIFTNADDCCEAVGIAMEECSAEKIDSKFLPLNITISEKV